MLDKQAFADQADSVLFLIVRRASDGAWLLYKRNSYPMRGYSGFMHALPNALETSTESAAKACFAWTGLRGTFTALGGGYFRVINQAGELESFTHFTLLYCNDVTGELNQQDEFAEYYWATDPNFLSDDFFPSTPALHDRYLARKPFFIEQNFTI